MRTIGKAKKSIICPYHHWTYSLEGELKNIPSGKDEFADTDMSNLCLHKASVETWMGMIFVHPEPDVPPLAEWFAGVAERIGPHRPDELIEYADGRTRTEINANWKIVVENYIDGYHLAHLHSETLYMYDHKKQESGFVGPHYIFFEPLTKSYLDIHSFSGIPALLSVFHRLSCLFRHILAQSHRRDCQHNSLPHTYSYR